ncbi:MAG: S1C family serine protease [Candidatus Izemoplasmataceae bacterium]
MKRIMIVLVGVFLVFTLSACTDLIDTSDNSMTEDELRDFIIDVINEESVDKDSYTQEELQLLIESLLPEARYDTTYDLDSFQSTVINMLADVRNGVLGVSVLTAEGGGSGSGVIYKKEGNDYYMVTNEHVVDGATSINIIYEKNGLLFEISNSNIELLGADPVTDLAVLKFSSSELFSVIPLSDSYDLQLGEFVYAIGNPLGYDYYGTVTMGVVSGLARFVNDGDFDATLLQHDAAISPGNSGGALVNINGELVGINNMKLVQDYVSGINFAIPSNTVRRVVEDLEDDGVVTRPYLGISTYATVNVCGLDYGVCVDVQPLGAAEEAGLENGDVIIGYKTQMMEEFLEVFNFNDLREAILNSSVGDEIVLRYYRNGTIYESDPATLDVHPDDR